MQFGSEETGGGTDLSRLVLKGQAGLHMKTRSACWSCLFPLPLAMAS